MLEFLIILIIIILIVLGILFFAISHMSNELNITEDKIKKELHSHEVELSILAKELCLISGNKYANTKEINSITLQEVAEYVIDGKPIIRKFESQKEFNRKE